MKHLLSLLCLIPLLATAGTPKFIAHRGDCLEAPEGSATAYRLAVERHYDIMKLDVQDTKDHVIVMSHDPTLKRMMNWDVKIKDVTYDEILRKGTYKTVGNVTGERIMTFKQALEFAGKLPELWIDTKYYTDEFFERILKELQEAKIDRSRVMVATFNLTALAHIQKQHPEIRRVMHISIKKLQDGKFTASFSGKRTYDSIDQIIAEIIVQKAKYNLFGVNIPGFGKLFSDENIKQLKDNGLWISFHIINNKATADVYRSVADAFVTDAANRIR